jgi:outer membrane lipoprotein-sorting protein
MRIFRLLLICFATTIVVIGCSKKIEVPEAASAPQQVQETAETYQAAAEAGVEEVKLNLTGVT